MVTAFAIRAMFDLFFKKNQTEKANGLHRELPTVVPHAKLAWVRKSILVSKIDLDENISQARKSTSTGCKMMTGELL